VGEKMSEKAKTDGSKSENERRMIKSCPFAVNFSRLLAARFHGFPAGEQSDALHSSSIGDY
jgi:hypothetical protein